MQLNCDLGESYGNWNMGHDAAVMPYIDQASIACGFHAGDPLTMRKTLALAAQHGVTIGAHPAYPDIVGFGRRSMTLSRDEIMACLHYQVAALEGMAQSQGLALSLRQAARCPVSRHDGAGGRARRHSPCDSQLPPPTDTDDAVHSAG